jgi:hypothetical protein
MGRHIWCRPHSQCEDRAQSIYRRNGWGIGFALYEHSVYDVRLGRIVNNNLAEYQFPTNADVGSIEAVWIDELDDP